jgi:hypothetical protein
MTVEHLRKREPDPDVAKVCAACGSEDVLCDACASWNRELQMWELDDLFDKGSWCNACERECRIEDRRIDEVPA